MQTLAKYNADLSFRELQLVVIFNFFKPLIKDCMNSSCNNKKFNYIIFHGGCLDGFSGFIVANRSGRLTKDVEIYEDTPSTIKIPPNIDDKDVIIIDVAYKKEVLEEIFKYAKSVVFIDHHVSIKEDVKDLKEKYKNNDIEIVYDSERCGSTLTWSYFFDTKIPLFLKYVEDQDTGKWIHPKTKPFIYAVRVYYELNTNNKSLKQWETIFDRSVVADLVEKGEYMKKYNDYIVGVNVPHHTLERFPSKQVFDMDKTHTVFRKPGQYKVAVYCGHNCPSITELGVGALEKLPDIDFCIMWVYNLDKKKYILSMRSREVDVSEICKLFNGGGHKLASACSFFASQLKIDDVFEGESLPRSFCR